MRYASQAEILAPSSSRVHSSLSCSLGTPINNIPKVENYDLDLHRLFKIVRLFGGYNKVRVHAIDAHVSLDACFR